MSILQPFGEPPIFEMPLAKSQVDKDYISKKELLEWIEENKKTIENTLDNKTYSTQPFVWVSEIINKFNLTN